MKVSCSQSFQANFGNAEQIETKQIYPEYVLEMNSILNLLFNAVEYKYI